MRPIILTQQPPQRRIHSFYESSSPNAISNDSCPMPPDDSSSQVDQSHASVRTTTPQQSGHDPSDSCDSSALKSGAVIVPQKPHDAAPSSPLPSRPPGTSPEHGMTVTANSFSVKDVGLTSLEAAQAEDTTAGAAPKVTAGATPKVTAEAAPEVAAESTPNVTAKAAPKATTEATPKVTAEATPKVTAEAAPKATPKATAEVTPNVTAGAIPESNGLMAVAPFDTNEKERKLTKQDENSEIDSTVIGSPSSRVAAGDDNVTINIDCDSDMSSGRYVRTDNEVMKDFNTMPENVVEKPNPQGPECTAIQSEKPHDDKLSADQLNADGASCVGARLGHLIAKFEADENQTIPKPKKCMRAKSDGAIGDVSLLPIQSPPILVGVKPHATNTVFCAEDEGTSQATLDDSVSNEEPNEARSPLPQEEVDLRKLRSSLLRNRAGKIATTTKDGSNDGELLMKILTKRVSNPGKEAAESKIDSPESTPAPAPNCAGKPTGRLMSGSESSELLRKILADHVRSNTTDPTGQENIAIDSNNNEVRDQLKSNNNLDAEPVNETSGVTSSSHNDENGVTSELPANITDKEVGPPQHLSPSQALSPGQALPSLSPQNLISSTLSSGITLASRDAESYLDYNESEETSEIQSPKSATSSTYSKKGLNERLRQKMAKRNQMLRASVGERKNLSPFRSRRGSGGDSDEDSSSVANKKKERHKWEARLRAAKRRSRLASRAQSDSGYFSGNMKKIVDDARSQAGTSIIDSDDEGFVSPNEGPPASPPPSYPMPPSKSNTNALSRFRPTPEESVGSTSPMPDVSSDEDDESHKMKYQTRSRPPYRKSASEVGVPSARPVPMSLFPRTSTNKLQRQPRPHHHGIGILQADGIVFDDSLLLRLARQARYGRLRGEMHVSADGSATNVEQLQFNTVKIHVYDLLSRDTLVEMPYFGCNFPIGQCFNVMNNGLHCLGTGAYHVGVEVNGVEYAFGANNIVGMSGIFTCNPQESPGYEYRETLDFGKVRTIKRTWIRIPKAKALDKAISVAVEGSGGEGYDENDKRNANVSSSVPQQLYSFREIESFADGHSVIHGMAREYMGTDYDLLRKNCCTFARDVCLRLGVKDEDIPSWFHNAAKAGADAEDCITSVEKSVKTMFDCLDDDPMDLDGYNHGFEVIADIKKGRTRLKVVESPPDGDNSLCSSRHLLGDESELRKTISWTY